MLRVSILIDEGNKRANYVNELDRMMGELYRPNLPHATKEHVNKWYEDTTVNIYLKFIDIV